MNRIHKEKEIVQLMIRLYCTKRHKYEESLCKECFNLLQYSCTRLDNCKFGDRKSSCRKCSVHCYRRDMREKIKEVMRFSGPRLIFYRPFEFWRHILRNKLKV